MRTSKVFRTAQGAFAGLAMETGWVSVISRNYKSYKNANQYKIRSFCFGAALFFCGRVGRGRGGCALGGDF